MKTELKSVRISKKDIKEIDLFREEMKRNGIKLNQIEIIGKAINFVHENKSTFYRKSLSF